MAHAIARTRPRHGGWKNLTFLRCNRAWPRNFLSSPLDAGIHLIPDGLDTPCVLTIQA